MILTTATFLFNLMCGLVPCDPVYKSPEVMSEPRNGLDMYRNIEKRMVEPIVKTESGFVEGHYMKSTKGRVFFAFEGIPYGETTAGANRWRPPVPKRPWRGVRQAKKAGRPCLQISLLQMLRVHGSEDCLFVNVFTPNIADHNKTYPVVVFIHGGSFLFGAGSEYGPAYMLNEDVVLVTLNYRLGVMGFLSTGDINLPGNYGLKDQALALKWVYDNIEHFGGNRNNITLMGNSAGSVSVNLHMISNKTRQYYTSAFSSSGTAFQNWAVQSRKRMQYLGNRLAERFGCQSEDSEKFVKCMRRIDSNFLVAAQLRLFDWFPFPPVMLSPTVEPEHPDAFLTIDPEEAYRKGMVAKKPYILGATKDEGKTAMIILLPFMRTYPLRVLWSQIAPYFLQYSDAVSDPQETTDRINEYYLNGTSPRWASLDTFGKMLTDRYLMFGIVKGVQAHASTGGTTYFYYFSFSNGSHNLADNVGMKSSEWGAGHSEEMFYFFNSTSQYNGHSQNDPDAELSSIMIKLLVNFAQTGEPSYKSESGEVFKIWEPIENPRQLKALKFDKEVEMIPFSEDEINRLQFWDSLKLNDGRTKLWDTLEYYRKEEDNR